MRNLNGRLSRLEKIVERDATGPEFTPGALATWQTCVDIAALVHQVYGGDRDGALSDFGNWPHDLKVRSNAFVWTMRAHLAPFFPCVGDAVWQEFMWHWLDFMIADYGYTTQQLCRPEALADCIETIIQAAIETGDYNG